MNPRGCLLGILLLSIPAMARAAATPSVNIAPVVNEVPSGRELRAKYPIKLETVAATAAKIAEDDPEQLREHIRQVLHAYIDKPKSMRINMGKDDEGGLGEGKFSRFVVEFRDANYDQIRLTHCLVEMKDVQFDLEELLLRDRIRFKALGRAEYVLEISEAEINRYIFANAKSLNVKNPKIELRNESIRFTGRVKSYNVRVDGGFQMVDGTKINFVPTRLRVSILPVPSFIARQVFDKLNPVADLAKLKVHANPDLIKSKPGKLYILTKGMLSQTETK